MAKIGRNAPCPCESGLKYKKCCGNPLLERPLLRRLQEDEIPPQVKLAFEKHKASELTRQQQQGLGNPIVSLESNGYRIVAVGSTLHWSKTWKTFHDFLFYYIKAAMNGDWGNQEIAKPFEQRHPILQWYDQICSYQRKAIQEPGKVASAAMTGLVEAYLHLAYNLYLLGHNTIKSEFSEKLQKRLIARLKDVESFPGAYYESYVFASLVRAGFEVEFENEIDGSTGHCDFIATCKRSGKKYSVEAKAIRRNGAYGATQSTAQGSLGKSIRNQLYDALKKPSSYPRIIFVEVNLPAKTEAEHTNWLADAVDAVSGAENLTINKSPAEQAFVILTNHPHHYHLHDENVGRSAVAVGYKIPDFGHGKKFFRLRDIYASRQKYKDINDIMDSIKTHYDIPSTFDGRLPSEAFHGNSQRITIGERYFFENVGEDGMEATVTSATVMEKEKTIYVGTDNGHILKCPISDEELEDYKKHPNTYFGVVHKQGRNTDDPYELFEWMLDSYINTPKEKLLEFMKDRPDFEGLKSFEQKELAIICCEGWVNALVQKSQAKKVESEGAPD